MVNDYKIVESYDVIQLEKTVKRHIKNGWELQGGVCVNNDRLYVQALVKFKTEGIK